MVKVALKDSLTNCLLGTYLTKACLLGVSPHEQNLWGGFFVTKAN